VVSSVVVPDSKAISQTSTRWRPVRIALFIVYAVVFVQQYRAKGFPFDRERIFLWIGAAFAIACLGGPWRRAVRLVVDWVPFLLMFIGYEISRGLAYKASFPVQLKLPVTVEKTLFGGTVPAAWLQRNIAHSGEASWWELGVSVVYATHFVLPFVVPALLWWRSRDRWKAWVLRFTLLTLAALITYTVLPVAPPWMAADAGLIEPLDRPVGRGWSVIGLTAATRLLHLGRIASNPVAAVPSMHAAYSLFIVLFFWKRIGNAVLRWATVLFPLVMGFSLVYGGEHYVIDVLAGWLYAAGAFWLAPRVERRWGSWRQRHRELRKDVP
jgi:membrane-associated phospholipid phosphatase